MFPNNTSSLLSFSFELPSATINTPPFFSDPLLPITVPLSEKTHFRISVFDCHVSTTSTPIPSSTFSLSTRSVDRNTQSLISKCESFDFDEKRTNSAFRVSTSVNLLSAISNDTSFFDDEQFTRTLPDSISTPSIIIFLRDNDPPNQHTNPIPTPSPFHLDTIDTSRTTHSPNPHNTLPALFSPISQPLGRLKRIPTITILPPDTDTTPSSPSFPKSTDSTFNSFSFANNPPISTFFSPTTTLPPNPPDSSIFMITLSNPPSSPTLHPTNTEPHGLRITQNDGDLVPKPKRDPSQAEGWLVGRCDRKANPQIGEYHSDLSQRLAKKSKKETKHTEDLHAMHNGPGRRHDTR
ncbi:hypothetical protein BLNAU_8233 [Blattamonas nauphoetae]|uniref:Uncharacterized protein n=1 Tax=Blattamonas nauphoetae TaxID=2049346 RepID=A0ABQ9XZ61_9EUKA|nr:hypothetical protein BLNAU_8233 [Blattamonas nauphoetae]